MQLITLEDVSKKYDGRYVINPINHDFEKGQSVAFLGHNGCGKSTLLKMIARLVTPTTGKVQYHDKIHFAYVPEKFMPLKLTARCYLRDMGEIEGMRKLEIDESINQLGEDFFLSEMLDVPMQSLSKGTLQKIGVIQAIMKKPDVLLLDEPLSGQDMNSQKAFVEKINELRDGNTTIFMSCHEQALVDALAEQVFTIKDGELSPYQQTKEHYYILVFENPQKLPIREDMERFGTGYRMIRKESEMQAAIMKLLQDGWILKGMTDYDTTTIKI